MSEVDDEFFTNLMQRLTALMLDNNNDPEALILFEQHKDALQERYFDYELLKSVLERRHVVLAAVWLNKGFRVRNPNITRSEETPLHLAMTIDIKYFLFIITTILNKGASMYDKNSKGETALYTAFKNKNYEAVDTVLDFISNCNFQNLNPANEDDLLHFHIACARKHLNSVKIFLELGFDVNSHLTTDYAEFYGLNPLQYAISYNYYSDLFLILLRHSDNLSIKNEGLTPLHIIFYNNYKIMQAFKYGNDSKFNNAVDTNGVSHFHLCCSIDCPDFVQVFINNGVDINVSTSICCPLNPGFTPLHFAVKYDCIEVVELLLKHGADCEKTDANGMTPLHLACLNWKTFAKRKIIEILLNYDACPFAVDKAGNTPIHLVFYKLCSSPDSEEQNIFDMLISQLTLKLSFDSVFDLSNRDGVSLFHIACATNDVNQVNDFIHSGIVIDACATSGKFKGYTALHFAALFNRKDVVEVLLKRRAQVNVKSSQCEVTPLHLACDFSMIKFYELNAQFNLRRSNDDLTNLDWISNSTNQKEIIKLLLLHGADVDAQDSLGKTPLLQVCSVNENEYSKLDLSPTFRYLLTQEINERVRKIIKILLSNKANVNARTNKQLSVLHIISENSLLKVSGELMEHFIAAGADVHAVDSTGLTPLHLAVERNNKNMVKTLLKYRVNVNAQCDMFRTPLKIAMDKYNNYLTGGVIDSPEDLCDILLANGSDINTKDQYHRTVFLDAIFGHKNIKVIEKLLCYGADICTLKSSCYSSLNVDIVEVIFIHVHKLAALGYLTSEVVRKKCFELLKYYKEKLSQTRSMKTLDSISVNCLKEIKRLKLKKIDNYNSLHSVLLKDNHELSKLVRNSILVNILENRDIDANFPVYSSLLKMQFRKGLVRSKLLKSAKKSLIDVLGLNLPDPCCDRILQYLTNEEVVSLKSAAETKNSTDKNQATII